MNASRIEELLFVLGCRRIRRSGNRVISTCPLAPWKHSGGVDKFPSFCVFVKEDGESRVSCMGGSCRARGTLSELVMNIQGKTGRADLSDLLLRMMDWEAPGLQKMLDSIHDGIGSARPPSTTHPSVRDSLAWTGGKDYSDPVTLSSAVNSIDEADGHYVLEMAERLNEEAVEYLHGPKRRFTDETIEKWKLGWHSGARRIAVPQYDSIGRLVNISGRYLPFLPEWLIETRNPKWMHSSGFDRDLYLFGESNFQVTGTGMGTVFLGEGAFDVIYLDQCGIPNVGAINGSHVSKVQIEKILHWFDHVVLVMDGDKPGREATDKIVRILSPRTRVSTYLVPDDRDPNDMNNDEIDYLKRTFLS